MRSKYIGVLALAGLGVATLPATCQARYTITDERASGQESPLVVVLHDHGAGAEAAIAPTEGGELSSFKVSFKGEKIELLYHARDYDHRNGFQGKGPLLWPAVGGQFPTDTTPQESCGLGSYTVTGKRYPMPCHGFARTLSWKETSRNADSHSARVTVELASSDVTHEFYPFAFHLDATYELMDGRLTIDYVVKSDASNSEPMPFSIGNHVAFKIPILPETDPTKVIFETQNTTQLLRNSAGFLSGEEEARSFYTPETLGSFDAHVALPLAGYKSQPFSRLIDPAGLTVRLTQTSSTTLPEPLVRINAYGGPNVGYFCPEPWFGVQNSLNTGVGLVKIDPGASWRWRLAIEVELPALAPVPPDSGIERIGKGFGFVEGPVWVKKDGGYLVFSDIYNSRTMKLAQPNHPEIYRRYTHAGNGNAMDTEGRLYTAERDGHRVVRTNLDGSETVIADKFEGKRLELSE